jgi:hypothetical protein
VVRLDAERDDVALGGGLSGLLAQFGEAGAVAHDMIGGEHDDDRLRRAARGEAGGHGDGGAGVAARGFEDDVGLGADLAQLVGDEKAIVLIGDDDRRLEGGIGHHGDGGLEGGAFADERDELLGQGLAIQATPACPNRRT